MLCRMCTGFYGGLSGLMPRAHLDLLAGQEPDDVYTVGQLIRCQVGDLGDLI